MPINVYDEGKLTGTMVEDKFVPLTPAPTGDEYDDLLLDVCRAILNYPGIKGRVSGDLTPLPGSVVQNEFLLKEIRLWIAEGDLRDKQQVNIALGVFVDWATRLAELDINPDWMLDLWSVTRLRWFFGVPGAESLPTKSQILAEREYREQKSAIDRRERNAEIARLQEIDTEIELDIRVKYLLRKIPAKLYSLDRVVMDDPLPPEYYAIKDKREVYRSLANETIIRGLIKEGKSDDEIQEEIIMDVLDTLTKVGRSAVPPLEEGQQRRYFTYNEFKEFLRDEWNTVLDTCDTTFMLGMDGLFVMDTAPKSKNNQPNVAAVAGSVA